MVSPLLERADDWIGVANERTRAKVVAVGDPPPAAAVIGGKTSGRKKSDIGTFSYGKMISDGPSPYVVATLQYGPRHPPNHLPTGLKVNLHIILQN